MPTDVYEKTIIRIRKSVGISALKASTFEAGLQFLLPGRMAKAHIKGLFFHRNLQYIGAHWSNPKPGHPTARVGRGEPGHGGARRGRTGRGEAGWGEAERGEGEAGQGGVGRRLGGAVRPGHDISFSTPQNEQTTVLGDSAEARTNEISCNPDQRTR